MAFDRQGAKQAGYSDQEIDAYLANKTQQPEQSSDVADQALSALKGVGSSFFPETSKLLSPLLGTLKGIGKGFSQLVKGEPINTEIPKEWADMWSSMSQPENVVKNIAPAGVELGSTLASGGAYGQGFKPFVGTSALGGFLKGTTKEQKGNVVDRVVSGGKQGLTEGTLSALLYPLTQALRFISKGSTNKLIEKGAKEGIDIDLNKVVPKATENIKSSTLKEAVKDFFTQYLPKKTTESSANVAGDISIIGKEIPFKVSSSDVLKIRREIAKNYGPSIFDWFIKPPQEKQAAAATRNALSSLLHEAAPGTKIPDKVYSIFAKRIGPVPIGAPVDWVKRYVIYRLLKPVAGKEISDIVKGLSGGD